VVEEADIEPRVIADYDYLIGRDLQFAAPDHKSQCAQE
jgi:hypothetical protein